MLVLRNWKVGTVIVLISFVIIVQALPPPHLCNDPPVCPLTLVSYTPSDYEKLWYDNINTWFQTPCVYMKDKSQEASIATWVSQSGIKNPHQELNESVFSTFLFKNECTAETFKSYIEPLAGISRHPLFCTEGSNYIVNKGYLTVDCNNYPKGARAFYFDLGASSWTQGGGGASQQWVDHVYRSCGVKFTGYYMWEASPMNPGDIFKEIPDDVMPYYHWYNIPAFTGKGAKDNPLTLLRILTRPEDYVVVKIDIDNTLVEYEFVAQILADPELLNLVDDFFWEHHVNVQEMYPWWTTQYDKQTLKDTYELFRKFRNAGVRAHSWV